MASGMRLGAWFALFLSLAYAFPRVGVHEGFTRLVFDLPHPGVAYTLERQGEVLTLFFPGLKAEPREGVVGSREVVSYQTLAEPGGVRVLVRLRGEVEVRTLRLQDPERLVLDLVLMPGPAPPAQAPSPSNRAPRPPRPVILLDPGHGGVDPGMVGYVVEKEVTLDLAKRLKALLERQGFEVRLTRDRDMHLAQDKREDLAQRAAMADSSRVNLFVSIHVNASPTRTAQGVEVFYFGQAQDQRILEQVIRENGGGEIGRRLTQEARTAAAAILKDVVAQANQRFSRRLAEELGRALAQAAGGPLRGVFPAEFFVLRYAKVPAVLVEVGFGDHPVEGRRLADPLYRERLAQGLFRGILAFLSNGALSLK